MNNQEYIGLTLEEAREKADAANLTTRVTNVDGEAKIVTCDYRPERLNFKIQDNIVISVKNG